MHPKCVLMMLAAICLAPTWAGAQDTKGFVQGVGGIRLTSAPGTAGSVGGTVGGSLTRNMQARMSFTLEVTSIAQLKRALALVKDVRGVMGALRR